MDTASKDVLFTIALNLQLPDLLRWCKSNKEIYKDVCNNKDVWRSKLLKDYSLEYEKFLNDPTFQSLKLSQNPKEFYVFLYQLSWIKKLMDGEGSRKENIYDIFLKKELNLSNKKLEKVPSFNLPNLEILYLFSNELKNVPVFNLPNLKELHLDNNQLQEVPPFDLPNLRYLSLHHNQLKELPSFSLPNLQELYSQNNQLKEVPSFNLPNLRKFQLGNNQLRKVPSFNLPNLQELYLYNNQLKEIPPFNLPQLEKLDLGDNQFTVKSLKEIQEKYKNVDIAY